VQGQLLPILTYGAELHQHPEKSMRRLTREWQRRIVGAWRGAWADNIKGLSWIEELDNLVRKKWIL